MSYAHHDERDGRLSKFRDRLTDELRAQTGTDIAIFMDSDAIQLEKQWRTRLDHGLAASTFLIAIITPSFLTSSYCREELETFRDRERALGRDDLILPVYYIDCEPFLTSTSDDPAAATARVVFERQFFDWRDLRTPRPVAPARGAGTNQARRGDPRSHGPLTARAPGAEAGARVARGGYRRRMRVVCRIRAAG